MRASFFASTPIRQAGANSADVKVTVCYTEGMRRPAWHLVVLLVVTAMSPCLFGISSAKVSDVNSQVRVERGGQQNLDPAAAEPLRSRSPKWLPSLTPADSDSSVTPSPKRPAMSASVISPQPSGVRQGVLSAEDLTVRDLRPGMTQDEVECISSPESTDDLGELGSRQAPSRFARTRLRFEGYVAYFDGHEVCGAARGNGLERHGVPILAIGDRPDDVERLLGQPTETSIIPRARRARGEWIDGCEWSYRYPAFILTVGFVDDRVSGFTIQANDFVISGC